MSHACLVKVIKDLVVFNVEITITLHIYQEGLEELKRIPQYIEDADSPDLIRPPWNVIW